MKQKKSPDISKIICQSCLVRNYHLLDAAFANIVLVESLATGVNAIPASYTADDSHGLPVIL